MWLAEYCKSLTSVEVFRCRSVAICERTGLLVEFLWNSLLACHLSLPRVSPTCDHLCTILADEKETPLYLSSRDLVFPTVVVWRIRGWLTSLRPNSRASGNLSKGFLLSDKGKWLPGQPQPCVFWDDWKLTFSWHPCQDSYLLMELCGL
jgi:hypothetical protein